MFRPDFEQCDSNMLYGSLMAMLGMQPGARPSFAFHLPHTRRQVDANETKAMETSSYDGKGSKQTQTSSSLCPPPTKSLPSTTTDSDHSTPGTGSGSEPSSTVVPSVLTSWQDKIGLAVGALFFAVVGIVVGRWSATRAGYEQLQV